MSEPQTVNSAFYAARKAARDARRAFAASGDSRFVQVMQSAMRQYVQARSQGVEREHAIKGLEEELRGAWPKSVSKFTPTCDACEDTGYREMTCWDRQRCGRKVCAVNPERVHLYAVPCNCATGDKMRTKYRAPEDELTRVGKTQKKRGGFSRMGQ
jgi:hypothetical protein